MFSDKDRTSSEIENIFFCVNVQHQCEKQDFCFLPSPLTVNEAGTPFFLYPSLLIFSWVQQVHAAGFGSSRSVVEKTKTKKHRASQSPPKSQLVRRVAFHSGASFERVVPERCVNPEPTTRCADTSGRNWLVSLPHITGQTHGGKQQTHYGDLVNYMRVGFCLFSFAALLTVCVPGFG